MGIELLRSAISKSDVTNHVPLAENSVNGQATIDVLNLSGLEHRSFKDEKFSDAKKKGLTRRLWSLRGKNTASRQDLEHKNNRAAAAPPVPARIVVWYQQTVAKSSNESKLNYLPSGNLNEETMDDEGVVHSWSCVWPGHRSSLNISLPASHKRERNRFIPLSVGVKYRGEDEIQPLGFAIVSVPEAVQTTLDISIPVDPIKHNSRLFGKFGAKQSPSRSCEYIISPSTVINVKIRVTCETSSSQRIFDTLVLMNSPTDTKNDQGSVIGSVVTEEASTASDEAATQRMGSKSKLATMSAEGSKTVKAANIASPSDASDVFSIDSVESVLDGDLAKPKSVVITSGGGNLTELKTELADVFIVPHVSDSPVPTSLAPSAVEKHQEKPDDIHLFGVSKARKITVMNDTSRPDEQMHEDIDDGTLVAFDALIDAFDEWTEANPSDKESLVSRLGPRLKEAAAALESQSTELQDLLAPQLRGMISLVKTIGQRDETLGRETDDQSEEQTSMQPERDIYRTLDSKLFAAFFRLNKSYDKMRDTFKKEYDSEIPEREQEVHQTLDHRPMMAFVELQRTFSDISGEELTVESVRPTPQVVGLRSQEDENQQQSQAGRVGAFKSIAQKEYGTFCAPQLVQVLEDAREGFADIIRCGLFDDEMPVADDGTCISLDSYGTTKYSYQSTICTWDNSADTIGSASEEGPVENKSKLWKAAKESKIQEQVANENQSPKKPAKNIESWTEASDENKNQQEAAKGRGSRGRIGGFIARLPSFPGRHGNGEANGLSSTPDNESNLEQPHEMIRCISSRSAGRPPTPAEKTVLESKFRCDGSVSVYSV
mmetsp:Transcript_3492/g.8890  ORF Transcript_3492/g.8890 Transcript_3492/m.8890 type:complete len:830 (-) Transcript_3492:67-2556(-)